MRLYINKVNPRTHGIHTSPFNISVTQKSSSLPAMKSSILSSVSPLEKRSHFSLFFLPPCLEQATEISPLSPAAPAPLFPQTVTSSSLGCSRTAHPSSSLAASLLWLPEKRLLLIHRFPSLPIPHLAARERLLFEVARRDNQIIIKKRTPFEGVYKN